jgi:hypothetical protein
VASVVNAIVATADELVAASFTITYALYAVFGLKPVALAVFAAANADAVPFAIAVPWAVIVAASGGPSAAA